MIFGAWLLAPVVAADALSERETRRLAKQARTSLEDSDLAKARELYRQLATEGAAATDERALAQWRVATWALDTDPEQAREWLTTLLREFPDSPWSGAAETLLGLYDDLAAARDGAAELRGRLEEREAEIAAASDQLAGSDEAKTSLEQSVAGLRRELTEARNRLATLEQELEKKDEALQKLKDALVGGGGR